MNNETGTLDNEDKTTAELVRETHAMVSALHETVSGLLNSVASAKAKGGMQGMLANQMFPDVPTMG